MCGIIGIVGTSEIASALYDGLTVLQHRGQDAAGIATAQGSRLRVHKGNGLVKDVFGKEQMHLLSGRMGIGHCRYPTAGSEGSDEAQPFYVNSPYGIALAHNGNLINTDATARRSVRAGPSTGEHRVRLRSAAQRVRARLGEAG
jgi:amidophosphoribosyltransferase